MFRGEIYIERGSLAILAASFEYDPLKLRNEENMFVARKSRKVRIRPVSAKYHVEYSKAGDHYHLSMVQGELRFKVRKKRQWIAARYDVNLDMAVTHVEPGNPPEIKISEQRRNPTILADENFTYDPDFWGTYNTIAMELDLEQALERIENSIIEITTSDE